jgi:hypothetical protein
LRWLQFQNHVLVGSQELHFRQTCWNYRQRLGALKWARFATRRGNHTRYIIYATIGGECFDLPLGQINVEGKIFSDLFGIF